MPLKKPRNHKLYKVLLLLFLLSLQVFLPQKALADYAFQTPALGIGDSKGVCPGDGLGLTRRIMPCIKETILTATNQVLIPFSDYLAHAVALCCLLAVMIHGAMLVLAKSTGTIKDSIMLVVKIGAVGMFSYNFGGSHATIGNPNPGDGFYPKVLNAMDALLGFVASYVVQDSANCYFQSCRIQNDDSLLQIWDNLDCVLEFLIGGVYSPGSIAFGIIGFLVACFFSGPIGYAIGMLGVFTIIKLIFAVIKSLYIFVTAYIGVSFMVIISPIFIPMVLFTSTKGYFQKWIRIFGSFILQPIFLFAYLGMLMAAFDVIVFCGDHSLFTAIAGNEATDSGFIDSHQGIGGWLSDKSGVYGVRNYDAQAVAINTKALKGSGLLPGSASDTGAAGAIATGAVDYLARKQKGMMAALGADKPSAKPRFFEINIPETSIDWETLAQERNFGAGESAYLIYLLLTFLMAFMTAYIFMELLDALPFIGAGIAIGGGTTESLGLSNILAQTGPSGSDVVKGMNLDWNRTMKEG